MTSKKLLIYMPALNEGETIYKVLKSVPTKINDISSIELLVVNDGSTDNTREESLKAGATVINHSRNKGLSSAFQTALDYSLKIKADILVSIDADGQFDVDQIKEMISPIINNQADFCTGNRFSKSRPEKMPKIKYWGNRQISRIVSFVGETKIQDVSCGFRAYSRDCLISFNLQGNFTYTHETILDLTDKGFIIEEVPVNVLYFEDRVSRIANSILKYATKTSIIIFKCLKDYRPLQFFLTIALFVLLVGICLGGFVFIHWINTGDLTPYKSLGIFALSLSGIAILLVVFALLADMLNRIRRTQEKLLLLAKKNYYDEN